MDRIIAGGLIASAAAGSLFLVYFTDGLIDRNPSAPAGGVLARPYLGWTGWAIDL
jgi:hypothetical protein